MIPKWSLQTIKIKDLKKHPKNPRTLSRSQFDQLKNSLDKFGLIDRPVVNTDMTIIGGHQRIQVLKLAGMKEVECMVPDRLLSEKEVEELLLRLNRNHGEFNYDDLANGYNVSDLLDYGFSIDELELSLDEPKEKKKKPKECPHCGGML